MERQERAPLIYILTRGHAGWFQSFRESILKTDSNDGGVSEEKVTWKRACVQVTRAVCILLDTRERSLRALCGLSAPWTPLRLEFGPSAQASSDPWRGQPSGPDARTHLARHAHLDHPVKANLLARRHEIRQEDVCHRPPRHLRRRKRPALDMRQSVQRHPNSLPGPALCCSCRDIIRGYREGANHSTTAVTPTETEWHHRQQIFYAARGPRSMYVLASPGTSPGSSAGAA